jgi:hypothetical protein
MTGADTVRSGIEMPDEVPMTTQEPADTSPIWYAPWTGSPASP